MTPALDGVLVLRRISDAGDLGLNLKSLGSGGSLLHGGHLVMAEVEQVADRVMGAQKMLCLPS
jgi:hypothetical protein